MKTAGELKTKAPIPALPVREVGGRVSVTKPVSTPNWQAVSFAPRVAQDTPPVQMDIQVAGSRGLAPGQQPPQVRASQGGNNCLDRSCKSTTQTRVKPTYHRAQQAKDTTAEDHVFYRLIRFANKRADSSDQ
ncbi:hypothetical protein PGTUg99_032866 [Puccinia graminis f. sp. tritici]|uniref:Uncharacterized protein n=1 Tax=Puccinia graminis f. sp. tritici TaxID=56615 RepID=A0A5B0RA45_PUCGR|nr:hypothetical protein PGTUg99_032866 [Puccinia graminis f. sp. tritici]